MFRYIALRHSFVHSCTVDKSLSPIHSMAPLTVLASPIILENNHGEPILRLVSDAMSEAPLPSVVDGSIGEATVQTVNARDLHAFMEVGRVFAAWIVERIQQYDFVEDVDYVVFSETGNNPQGGRPSKEYAISLDMAKELSMVERNEKGKQARRYFIECERKVKFEFRN